MGWVSEVLKELGWPLREPPKTPRDKMEEYLKRLLITDPIEGDWNLCRCGQPAVLIGLNYPWESRCSEHLDVRGWSNQGPGGTWVPMDLCESPRHAHTKSSHERGRPCWTCEELDTRFRQVWDGTTTEGVY